MFIILRRKSDGGQGQNNSTSVFGIGGYEKCLSLMKQFADVQRVTGLSLSTFHQTLSLFREELFSAVLAQNIL